MPIRHIISQSFGHMCLNIGELRFEIICFQNRASGYVALRI